MENLKRSFSFKHQNLALIVCFFLPITIFIVAGFWFLELSFYRLKFIVAENLFFSFSLFLFSFFFKKSRFRYIFLMFGYFILAFKVLVEISYYNLYPYNISASTIFIIMESNIAESAEYLQSYFSGFNFALITLLFVPMVFFKFLTLKPLILSLTNKLINGGVIIMIIGVYYFKNLQDYNLYSIVWNSYQLYQNQMSLYENYGLHSSYGNFKEVTFNGSSERKIYVLVIGESTTRHRMGIYNYPRNTNPLLTKIKEELTIFEDVISPHTHTIPSLSKMMSLSNYEDEDRLSEGSIIQLMNQAGFNTYWISNQRPVGWNESLISRIAEAADETSFINQQADFLTTPYDSALIPYFNETIDSKKEKIFVVIHLLGTHNKYSKRYPEDRLYYSGNAPLSISENIEDNKIINEYDNAVVFNDYILYEIISRLKLENASSYMLYVSDHGEDVFQVNNSASHTETMGTYPMYDVPFVLWSSKKFMHEKLKANVRKKYMLDDLIYSIADLSEIKFKSFEPQRSIFSDSLIQRKRLIYNEQNYDSIFER